MRNETLGTSEIGLQVVEWFADECAKDQRIILTDIPQNRMIGGQRMCGPKVMVRISDGWSSLGGKLEEMSRGFAVGLVDQVLEELGRKNCTALELSRVETREMREGDVESICLGFKARVMNIYADWTPGEV